MSDIAKFGIVNAEITSSGSLVLHIPNKWSNFSPMIDIQKADLPDFVIWLSQRVSHTIGNKP